MSESDPDLSESKTPYKCLQALNGHRLSTFEEFILFCNSQCSLPHRLLRPLRRDNRYAFADVDDFTHQIALSAGSLSDALKHVIRPGTLRDEEFASLAEDMSKEINKHTDAYGQLSVGGLISESNRLLLNLKCQKFEDPSQHFPTDFTEDYDYFRELESVLDPSIYLVQMSPPPKHCIYIPGGDFYHTAVSLTNLMTPELIDTLSTQLFKLNYADTLICYDYIQPVSTHSYYKLLHTLGDLVFNGFNKNLHPDLLSKLLNVYLCFTFMNNNYTFGLETLIKIKESFENIQLNYAVFEEFLTFSTLVSMELPIVTSIDDSLKLVAGVPPLGAHLYRIAFKNILFTSERSDGANTFALWNDFSFLSKPFVTLSIANITMEFLPLQVKIDLGQGQFSVEMPKNERFDVEIFIESPVGNGSLYEKKRKLRVFLSSIEILSTDISVTNFLEFSLSHSGCERLIPMAWTADCLSKWAVILGRNSNSTNLKSPPPHNLLDLIESYITCLHRLSYNYGVFRGTESLPRILTIIERLISIDSRFGQSLGMLKHDAELRFNSLTSTSLLKMLNGFCDSPSPALPLLRSLREPQLYELLVQSPSADLVNLLYSLSCPKAWTEDLQRVIRLATPKLMTTCPMPYKFKSSSWYDLFNRVSTREPANPFYVSLIKHAILHITATLFSTRANDCLTSELFSAASTLASKVLDISVKFSSIASGNICRDLALSLSTFYLLANPAASAIASPEEDLHIFHRLSALLGIWTKLVACSTQTSSAFAKFCSQLTLHLCDYLKSIGIFPKIPCKLLCGANIARGNAQYSSAQFDFPFMPLFPQVLRAIRLVSAPPVAAQASPPLPDSIALAAQPPQATPATPPGPAPLGAFNHEIKEISERLKRSVSPFTSTPELNLALRRYNMRLLAKVQEIKSNAGPEPPYRLGDLEFPTLSDLERHFFNQIAQRCDLISLLFEGTTQETSPEIIPMDKKIGRSWRSHSLPSMPDSPLARVKPAGESGHAGPPPTPTAENLTSLLDVLVSGPSAASILRSVYGQQLRSLLLYLALRSILAIQSCDGKPIAATLSRAVSTCAVQVISLGCTKGLQPLSEELLQAVGFCIAKLFGGAKGAADASTPLVVIFSALLLGPFKDSRMTAPFIKQLFIDSNSINSAIPLLWIFLVGHQKPQFDVQRAMIWSALQFIKSSAGEAAQPPQVSLSLMIELRKIFERVESLALVRYLFESILATFAIGSRRTHSVSALGVPFSQLLDVAIRRLHALEPKISAPIGDFAAPEATRTPVRGRGAPGPVPEASSPAASSTERCESSVDRVQGEYLFNWLPLLGSIPSELLYSNGNFIFSSCSGGFSMAMPHKFHLEERCPSANLISNEYFLSQGPCNDFYPLLIGPSICVTSSGGLGGIVIFPIPCGLEFSAFSQNFEGVQTSIASFTICTEGHFGVTVAPADVVLSSVSELFNRNDAVAFTCCSCSNSELSLERYATSVSFNQGDVLEANFALHTDSNGQFCLRTELVVAGNSIGSILEVIYDPETQKDPCRRMSLIFIFPSVQALIFDDSNSLSRQESGSKAAVSSSSPFSFRELESAEFNIGAISSFVDRIQLYQSILMVDFRLLGSLKSILLRRWLDLDNVDENLPGWIAVLGCDTAKNGWERVKNLLSIQLSSVKLGKDISKHAALPALPWLSTFSCVSHSPISRLNTSMLLEIVECFIESEVEWWLKPFLLVILTLCVKRLTPPEGEALLGHRDLAPELFFDIADKLYHLSQEDSFPPIVTDPHERYHGGKLLYAEASLADLNLQLMRAIPNYICQKMQSGKFDKIISKFLTRDICIRNGTSDIDLWTKFTSFCIETTDKIPSFIGILSAPLQFLIPFLLSLPSPFNAKLTLDKISKLDKSELKSLPCETLRLIVENEIIEISFSIEQIATLLIDSITADITTNFNLKIPRHFERYKIARNLHDLASIWVWNSRKSKPNLESGEFLQFKRLALYLAVCSMTKPDSFSSTEEAITKSFSAGEAPLPGYFMDFVLGPGRTCLSGFSWIAPLRAAVDYYAQNTPGIDSDSDSESEYLVDSRLTPADNRLLAELSSDKSGVVSEYLRANPRLADFVRPASATDFSSSADSTPISRVADSVRVLRAVNSCAMTAIPLIAPLFSGPHVYYAPDGDSYRPFCPIGSDVLSYLSGKLYLLKQTTNELWSKGFFSAKVQNSGTTFSAKPYFSIRVDRTLVDGSLQNSLLSQSTPQILSCDPTMLLSDSSQKPFMIVFKGERSTDFGGPFHEFLSSLSAEVALLTSDGQASLMEQCPNYTNSQGGYQDTLLFKYTPHSVSISGDRTSPPCDAMPIGTEFIGTASCWFGCCDLPSCRNLSLPKRDSNVEPLFGCQCGGAEAQNSPCATPIPEELRVYEALGRICAMCASMSIPFGVFLNPIVWKKLVFEPLSRDDIALFDEATLCHISMIAKGNLSDLRFEVGETSSPSGLADLLPDGRDIPVTSDNLSKYVNLLKLYKINQGNIGLSWFAKGFAAVLPLGYIRLMLDSGVVEYMVCGDPEIDLNLLREHTRSSNNGLLQKFFTVISGFTNEQLKALLRFVSGRSRLPPAHYSDWKFRIEYEAEMPNADSRLPTSATCNFRLLVPRYSTLDIFRERLLYATLNCVAIDLDV